MLSRATEQFLAQVLAIEADSVTPADLGFMARSLTLCTMPHSKPSDNEFTRRNGSYTLTMQAPKTIGLPYGSLPRLLLAWIVTEAVQTKSRTLTLGHSLSDFLKELGLSRQGGERGDITRLRQQMRRLFSCSIRCEYQDGKHDAGIGFMVADSYSLWWHPQEEKQAGLWESTLTLSEKFYQEITAAPIPLDMRALKALKRSPMSLDLYMWLTFRNSYLKTPTVISWQQLQQQFGAEYNRTRAFREAFRDAMRKVLVVYPTAQVTDVDNGLMLSPSPTHVPRKVKTLLTE